MNNNLLNRFKKLASRPKPSDTVQSSGIYSADTSKWSYTYDPAAPSQVYASYDPTNVKYNFVPVPPIDSEFAGFGVSATTRTGASDPLPAASTSTTTTSPLAPSVPAPAPPSLPRFSFDTAPASAGTTSIPLHSNNPFRRDVASTNLVARPEGIFELDSEPINIRSMDNDSERATANNLASVASHPPRLGVSVSRAKSDVLSDHDAASASSGQKRSTSPATSSTSHFTRTPAIAASSRAEAPTRYNPPSIVIIVMGLTGAGKSRFVKEATGLDVNVGHSLVSTTADITPYEVKFGDHYGFLIDTPGFDDTYRTDVEIFRDVADWLARQYVNHELLTSVIYVHRITDIRVSGSAFRNLTVMKKMLGVESFRNLVIITSMWDLVDPMTGEERENELRSHFWTDLLRAGARMQRFAGTKESAAMILRDMRSESPVTLTIQRELVDDRLNLDQTTAGSYLERELLRSNAQNNSDVLKHAQSLDQVTNTSAQQSSPSQSRASANIGHSMAPLRSYWNPASRALNQQTSASCSYKKDPEMYTPFQWEDDFRLITLRAGSGTSPIEISLAMTNLANPEDFVALSYVVGNEPADAPINFRRDRYLSQLYVPPNLREALQRLRLPDEDLLIWVDAISINQEDLDERARQVRMMSHIFRTAQGVCIWLGSSSEGGDIAMDFIQSILDFALLEDLVKNEEHNEKWLLLAKLMSRPWFRRRWVVQEIMFARDATVHCGDRIVAWSDFCDAATLFRTKWADIQRHMGDNELTELGDAHLLGAIALIEVSNSVFRRDADGNILEKLMTTEKLLALLPMFEATDQLDTVYAIMDMANDIKKGPRLVVNYELQPAELFRDTIKLVATNSGSLDIICRPWAPRVGLPSWITTVAKHPYRRRPNRQQYDRQYGNSLVGMPGSASYRACGILVSTPQNTAFRADGAGSQQVLSVTGQTIGRIYEIGDRSMNGNIPQEWMHLAGWMSLDKPVPPAFWRTLTANRAANGSPAPDWYGRACEFAFRKSTTDDINTTSLSRLISSSHVQEFLTRVLDVTWRRTFGLVRPATRSDNAAGEADHTVRFALCPPETRSDDLVVIVYGCSVPVVLRQQVSYYEFIGECFVYGVMDGEAIDPMNPSKVTYDII